MGTGVKNFQQVVKDLGVGLAQLLSSRRFRNHTKAHKFEYL